MVQEGDKSVQSEHGMRHDWRKPASFPPFPPRTRQTRPHNSSSGIYKKKKTLPMNDNPAVPFAKPGSPNHIPTLVAPTPPFLSESRNRSDQMRGYHEFEYCGSQLSTDGKQKKRYPTQFAGLCQLEGCAGWGDLLGMIL